MEEFFKRGYSWATKSTYLEFNRPLYLGDTIIVRTWVKEIKQKSVKVCFQIQQKGTEEIASEGYFVYILINVRTGKPENIPEDIIKIYSV
jgi:acyl-CoA thioester hydrolase/thioesterase-3